MDDYSAVTVLEKETADASTDPKLKPRLPIPDSSSSSGGSLKPATPRERFSAFLTDHIILAHLILAWSFILTHLAETRLAPPFSIRQPGWFLLITTSAGIYFLYFLLFESVLTATPGKLLSGLSIQRVRGGTPSLFSILIRNVLRGIDYPFFLITAVGMMERNNSLQRLGDWLARTVVIREIKVRGSLVILDPERTAGATRRILAAGFDTILFGIFVAGYVASLPSSSGWIADAGLSLTPLVALLFWSLPERILRATPGKALLGMHIADEEGRSPSFASVLSRNFLRILDHNPFGYLLIFLSSRHQRIGDLVSSTLVLRAPRTLRTWLAVPFLLCITGALGFWGWKNSDSFYRKDMKIGVFAGSFDPVPDELLRFGRKDFHVESLSFGYTEAVPSEDAVFFPGSTVFLSAEVAGFRSKGNRAWVQGDLVLQDPTGQTVLDKKGFLNSSSKSQRWKSLRMTSRFVLHPLALPGAYTATLTLRDVLGHTRLEQKKLLLVKR